MDSQARDRLLFEKLKTGDRLALNSLFDEYYQRLCAFAFTYLKNKEEAEEMVADVFVRIWRNRNEIDIHSSVRSYFYASARHACLALLNRSRLQTVDLSEQNEHLLITDEHTPQERLELMDLEQLIKGAVDTLPLACRRIFIMSRFDGLKYKEIGEILSISEKTVENQIVKALNILRERLKDVASGRPGSNYPV